MESINFLLAEIETKSRAGLCLLMNEKKDQRFERRFRPRMTTW
jgi:hypothetical protein